MINETTVTLPTFSVGPVNLTADLEEAVRNGEKPLSTLQAVVAFLERGGDADDWDALYEVSETFGADAEEVWEELHADF